MIAVVQRVLEAKVIVAGETVGAIGPGMVVLASVERDDRREEMAWMAEKLAGLRIFRSAGGEKHFDQDIKQVGGSMLLVSNFTVAAETRKGRRPSLDGAASPGEAEALFTHFVEAVRARGIPVATGRFGADMKVHLINDGPVTFIVRSDPPAGAGGQRQAP
jgi:D-tyrosyl-tRNA(Tyr) deacylase